MRVRSAALSVYPCSRARFYRIDVPSKPSFGAVAKAVISALALVLRQDLQDVVSRKGSPRSPRDWATSRKGFQHENFEHVLPPDIDDDPIFDCSATCT